MRMAIFGLARSGISALNFLARQSGHECFVVNQGPPESWDSYQQAISLTPREHCFAEEEAQDLLASVDLIIKSPGVPFGHKALEKAREKRVEIISEIEFAFRNSDIPVIAITGTNGKTTTATMTAQLLTRLNKKVFLGGNIGVPYSEILRQPADFDWAVIEVSSFQLENIKSFKPRVAVLTNLSPSHGERYESHELYRDAKLKLFQNMDDDDLALLPEEFLHLNLPCPKEAIQSLARFDYSQSQIRGEHNKQNLFCAYSCAKFVVAQESGEKGRRESKVDRATRSYIKEYQGVSFRSELIFHSSQLDIFNDGKSTNLASTLAAIDSMDEKPLHLILGGKLRGEEVDFSRLISKNINHIYCFGEAGDYLCQKLKEFFEVSSFNNLEELVNGFKSAPPKGALLFSPAFPSFDLYKNYEERALHFNSLCERIFKN